MTAIPIDANQRFGDGHWTLKELKTLIQNKITERTAYAMFEKQDAYKLFGRPANGITSRHFRKQLKKWGIRLSSKDMVQVFRYFDVTGSGTITFQELVSRLMPKDYTEDRIWTIRSIEAADAKERAQEPDKCRPILSSSSSSHFSDLSPVQQQKRIAELQQRLQTKILERVTHGTTESVDAYKLFGRPKNGITKTHFAREIRKFGMDDLELLELDLLFTSYDTNKSGTVTFAEFIHNILPQDYTTKLWNVRSNDHQDAQLRKQNSRAQSRARLKQAHFPPSLRNHRWTTAELEKMIQDKITAKTSKPTVEKKDAFDLFGRPQDGITPAYFKKYLEDFGLFLTKAEIRQLFAKYDINQSGSITFQEFIAAVMPQEYTVTQWTEKSVAKQDAHEREMKMETQPSEQLKVVRPTGWSIDRMTQILRDKIRAHTANSNVEIQDAYKLFGRPKEGITIHVFTKTLHDIGMIMTERETRTLFNYYDKNESGIINFHELVTGIMAKDYTQKMWNVVRDEEQDALAAKKESRKKHRHKKHQLLPPTHIVSSLSLASNGARLHQRPRTSASSSRIPAIRRSTRVAIRSI